MSWRGGEKWKCLFWRGRIGVAAQGIHGGIFGAAICGLQYFHVVLRPSIHHSLIPYCGPLQLDREPFLHPIYDTVYLTELLIH